jgi:hypothetical protein
MREAAREADARAGRTAWPAKARAWVFGKRNHKHKSKNGNEKLREFQIRSITILPTGTTNSLSIDTRPGRIYAGYVLAGHKRHIQLTDTALQITPLCTQPPIIVRKTPAPVSPQSLTRFFLRHKAATQAQELAVHDIRYTNPEKYTALRIFKMLYTDNKLEPLKGGRWLDFALPLLMLLGTEKLRERNFTTVSKVVASSHLNGAYLGEGHSGSHVGETGRGWKGQEGSTERNG